MEVRACVVKRLAAVYCSACDPAAACLCWSVSCVAVSITHVTAQELPVKRIAGHEGYNRQMEVRAVVMGTVVGLLQWSIALDRQLQHGCVVCGTSCAASIARGLSAVVVVGGGKWVHRRGYNCLVKACRSTCRKHNCTSSATTAVNSKQHA
jgi:hypothetical protein